MRFHLCMRCFATAVLVLGACNSGVQPTTTASVTPPVIAPVVAEPIAKGIPHGSQIIAVAVTDDGDAALTFDNTFGVRLWPTLDGGRPPVPLSIEAPRQVSLARAGRDLLAVITSDAGSVRVMRLGRDGTIRGNVTLPDQYEQAIAIDDAVLVRTPDHAVERYATDGTLRGRVVADPGKQITTVVTRNGHSAALIANAQNGLANAVRWIAVDDGLSWGSTMELPSNVLGELVAIAPNGRRIAFTNASRQLEVWEAEPFKRRITGNTMTVEESARIGFIDDRHVAVNGTNTQEVRLWKEWVPPAKTPEYDPWAVTPQPDESLPQPREQTHLIDGFAIADGRVVTGFGVALSIATLDKVQYLGYKALPVGLVNAVADQFAMHMGAARYVWLDEQLVVHRDEDLQAPAQAWMYAVALDDDHVVTQTTTGAQSELALVDLDTKAKTPLGKFQDLERIQYDEATRVFGIKVSRKLHRFAFDGEALTALPGLRVKGSTSTYKLFDPKQANGMTAAVAGWDSDMASYESLTMYRDKGKPTRIYPFIGSITAATPDGTLYAFEPGQLRIYSRGQSKPAKVKLPGANYAAVSRDGSRFAYATRDELVVADATGAAIWRQPQWGASQLVFSSDASKIVVRGVGGLAVYDATNGARIAMECGWNFGLHDEPLTAMAAGAQPMCEDPMLQ